MVKKKTLFLCAASISLTVNAFVIDWNKIQHWAGQGDNKAALVVQFNDGGAEKAYVWGYRWSDPYEQPSGEKAFRAIAAECNDLYLFTQYTGWMGNTVCGIGYSDSNAVANHIEFDFSTALDDPNISFNWFTANASLGQSSVPGWDTPDLCEKAIEDSKKTHILEHPIDAKHYGYACYDYDHWNGIDLNDSIRWQAGWYEGYWSYWVGGVDSETLSYSGLGYTSRKLTDGSVDAWKYIHLNGPVTDDDVDGYTGASAPWYQLDYAHFSKDNSGVSTVSVENQQPIIYNLNGVRVGDPRKLKPGIYISVRGKEVSKIIIK